LPDDGRKILPVGLFCRSHGYQSRDMATVPENVRSAGEDRKSPVSCQTDANDPTATLVISRQLAGERHILFRSRCIIPERAKKKQCTGAREREFRLRCFIFMILVVI
jgi:hypothetical protein